VRLLAPGDLPCITSPLGPGAFGWSGTVGNGVLVQNYTQVGHLVFHEIEFTWGSTTSHPVQTQSFTLPNQGAMNSLTSRMVGTASMGGGSGIIELGAVLTAAGNVLVINRYNGGFWSNTVPTTWTTGHILTMSLCYHI
jgi:hypothetical protein